MLRILQNFPLSLLLCHEPFSPFLPCHLPRYQGSQTPVQGATAGGNVCTGPGGHAPSCQVVPHRPWAESCQVTLFLKRRWKSKFLCEIVLTFKHWQVTQKFLNFFSWKWSDIQKQNKDACLWRVPSFSITHFMGDLVPSRALPTSPAPQILLKQIPDSRSSANASVRISPT